MSALRARRPLGNTTRKAHAPTGSGADKLRVRLVEKQGDVEVSEKPTPTPKPSAPTEQPVTLDELEIDE